MLSVQSGEPPAHPVWFLSVQEDLRFAWKTVALLASAPPPDLEAPCWIDVMKDLGQWTHAVKSVHFFKSALDDRAAAKRAVVATLSKTHECNECHNKFASERALTARAQRAMGTERSGANALTFQAFVQCAKRLFKREFVC